MGLFRPKAKVQNPQCGPKSQKIPIKPVLTYQLPLGLCRANQAKPETKKLNSFASFFFFHMYSTATVGTVRRIYLFRAQILCFESRGNKLGGNSQGRMRAGRLDLVFYRVLLFTSLGFCTVLRLVAQSQEMSRYLESLRIQTNPTNASQNPPPTSIAGSNLATPRHATPAGGRSLLR